MATRSVGLRLRLRLRLRRRLRLGVLLTTYLVGDEEGDHADARLVRVRDRVGVKARLKVRVGVRIRIRPRGRSPRGHRRLSSRRGRG